MTIIVLAALILAVLTLGAAVAAASMLAAEFLWRRGAESDTVTKAEAYLRAQAAADIS